MWSKKGLTIGIFYLNVRSLVNKLSTLHAFVFSSNYSIYCFTETWLSNHIMDVEVIPSGFTIYRKDRSTRGGGVLIAVKSSIPSSASLLLITWK